MKVALVTVLVWLTSRDVTGEGMLMEPPSRSSLWRFGYQTPINYNDHALNCGGLYTQWFMNQGRCGVCGDPYNQAQPRDNEAGGRYGKGIITRTYTQGQVMEVKVDVTANHLGWFEFRLCEHNSPSTPITQQCLDQHLLQLADGSGTRYTLSPGVDVMTVKLRLPQGVTCTQCVLQWKWHGGNNYGQDSSGVGCVGCGPVQEEFYGCSDIAVGFNVSSLPSMTTTHPRPATPTVAPTPPITPPVATPTLAPTLPPFRPLTTSKPSSVVIQTYPPFHPITPTVRPGTNPFPPTIPTMRPSLSTIVPATPTLQPFPPTLPNMRPSLSTSVPATPTVSPNPQVTSQCIAINAWSGVANLDLYCQQQCPGSLCPTNYCSCTGLNHTQSATPSPTQASLATPTPVTATPYPVSTMGSPTTLAVGGHCYGVNTWKGNPILDQWCTDNCHQGLCPPQNCACNNIGGLVSSHASPASSPTQPPITTTASPTLPATNAPTTPPSTNAPTTPPVSTSSAQTTPWPSNVSCRATGLWAGQTLLDQWCTNTCIQYGCDPQYCSCVPNP